MRRLALFAALALLSAAAFGSATRAEPAAAAKPRLQPFRSCGQFLDYARSQAGRFVGPYGLGTFGRGGIVTAADTARTAAPVKGVDFSGTNVQEEGVDEPDLVKTDGKTLFVAAQGRLNAVDATGAKPQLLDTLKLDESFGHELLLHGDTLLVLSRGGFWAEPLPATSRMIAPYQPAQSVLSEVDVSDPKRLRLVRTLTLDGSYVAARLVGSAARIVASATVPQDLPFDQPDGASADPTRRAATYEPSSVSVRTRRSRFGSETSTSLSTDCAGW